jgi:hypothetical protein
MVQPSGLQRSARDLTILGGVTATAAAGLAFEIALTRVFAIAQFYHFAFLSVGLALLGLGASGSVLSAFPRLGRGGRSRWAWLAAAQALTMIGAYLLTNALPFDSFAIAWDGRQVAYLVIYYLALAVPFFFGGLVVAILLAGGGQSDPVPSRRVYGASLAGSGMGAVAALVGLTWFGAEASIVLAAALSLAGAVAFLSAPRPLRRRAYLAGFATLGLIVLAIWLPGYFEVRLSPYKDLSAALRYPGSEVVATTWDQGTRIDLVQSDGIRSLPGLSLTFVGEVPPQNGITFDGDGLSPIVGLSPSASDAAGYLLGSLASSLRPGAAVLVLAPRGGLDVTMALAGGARSITAVEPHRRAVEAIAAHEPTAYDDSRVSVVFAAPRTFVERTDAQFDIVDLALTDPYRTVTSGAYSLAEDYLLTVQAFTAYLDRLAPDGIFTAVRWVQVPPSEETRLLALAVEALLIREEDPARAIVMLRSYSNAVLLVRPDGFSASDLDIVESFALANRFDVIVAPDLEPTNRFYVVPEEPYSRLADRLLASSDPGTVYRAHEFDISAPTDDQPFFSHFFKWSQAPAVVETLGRTWQPFGGAGYFVLVALLALSTAAAIGLISAPLLMRRQIRRAVPGRLRWWTVGYFGLLGLAFLFVEIPLIQQYILLVGRPTAAFGVVVSALLVASGLGSTVSHRIPWRLGAVTLTASAFAYPLLIRWVSSWLLPTPLGVRVVAGALLLFPLGILMGIMFPHGLGYLERRGIALAPWAWAINGTVSVISAAAAALLALGFGFSIVVQAGALAYGLATLLVRTGTKDLNPVPG